MPYSWAGLTDRVLCNGMGSRQSILSGSIVSNQNQTGENSRIQSQHGDEHIFGIYPY